MGCGQEIAKNRAAWGISAMKDGCIPHFLNRANTFLKASGKAVFLTTTKKDLRTRK